MNQPQVVVTTKKELEEAIKNNSLKILVKGDLAEKIHQGVVIKNLSRTTLFILAAAIAATPFTGGVSGLVGVAGITATTGMSIVAITAVSFLGVALILSITNGYDRKFHAKAEGLGEASMELNRKNKGAE